MEEEPQQFWDRFADLIRRDETSLTPDERESLKYFTAFRDVFLGLTPNTKARRWAGMAWEIGLHARELGRAPDSNDAGLTREQKAWMAAQRPEALNSFQRAYLQYLTGRSFEVAD